MKIQTYFRCDLAIVVPDDDPGRPIHQYGDILYEVVTSDSETNVECAKTGTRGTLALLRQTYPRTNFHLKRPLTAVAYHTGIPIQFTPQRSVTQ